MMISTNLTKIELRRQRVYDKVTIKVPHQELQEIYLFHLPSSAGEIEVP